MKTRLFAAALVLLLAACTGKTNDGAGAGADTFAMPADLQSTPSGLQYAVEQPGTGAQPQTGQTVTVHYTGWLTDGSSFDSSRTSGNPFNFELGAGQVIQGWDLGVASMKTGGRRTLVIPPDLGYGGRGAGGVIPPYATALSRLPSTSRTAPP